MWFSSENVVLRLRKILNDSTKPLDLKTAFALVTPLLQECARRLTQGKYCAKVVF